MVIEELNSLDMKEMVQWYIKQRSKLVQKIKDNLALLYTEDSEGFHFTEKASKETMKKALKAVLKVQKLIEENDKIMQSLIVEQERLNEHASKTRNKIIQFNQDMGFEMPLPKWIKEMYRLE